MYTNVISVVTQQIPPLCTDEVSKLHRITFKDFRLLFRSDEIMVKSSILYLLTEVVRLSAVRLSAPIFSLPKYFFWELLLLNCLMICTSDYPRRFSSARRPRIIGQLLYLLTLLMNQSLRKYFCFLKMLIM